MRRGEWFADSGFLKLLNSPAYITYCGDGYGGIGGGGRDSSRVRTLDRINRCASDTVAGGSLDG